MIHARPDRCTRFRVYTAALADGERGHVPWRARVHIRQCRACQAELGSQLTIDRWMRERLGVVERARIAAPRRRGLAWGAAAAVVIICAGITLPLLLTTGHDPVPAAVAAAARPPMITTGNEAAIDRWCQGAGAAVPPVLTVAGLALDGARMDPSTENGMMVTVYYASNGGGSVVVTWVAGTSNRGAVRPTAVALSRSVLVVRLDSEDRAVVTGSAALGDLWRTAAVIAANL